MAVPLQISYRDVTQSDALDQLIAAEAAKLERYFGRVLGCRVLVEHAHEHQRSGAPFQARITVNLPGEDVFVNGSADVDDVLARFKDPALAVRDAFKKARRQMQDRIRVKREPASRW
ncbi:MAG TPA: HPF/RaiA family ribosome-associated protein [Candidatus Baltobacteraceae bacterium]|nr:HPF/RaiA family ribosome-associated protein [Candidatus Baltobacteraceae bacterium]